MQVGIESNDYPNKFSSGTSMSNAKYRSSGGLWNTWTSATNADSNGLNWSSYFSYSGGNNTITFSNGGV